MTNEITKAAEKAEAVLDTNKLSKAAGKVEAVLDTNKISKAAEKVESKLDSIAVVAETVESEFDVKKILTIVAIAATVIGGIALVRARKSRSKTIEITDAVEAIIVMPIEDISES